jgi:hypothetical protein
MRATNAIDENQGAKTKGTTKSAPVAKKRHKGPRVFDLLLRIGNGALTVKRIRKQGWYVAEDLLEDFAHAIKKRPIRSVGLGTAVGFGVGSLVGWICSRGRNSRRS